MSPMVAVKSRSKVFEVWQSIELRWYKQCTYGAKSFGYAGQLKRRATVWLAEWQSGHVGLSARLTEGCRRRPRNQEQQLEVNWERAHQRTEAAAAAARRSGTSVGANPAGVMWERKLLQTRNNTPNAKPAQLWFFWETRAGMPAPALLTRWSRQETSRRTRARLLRVWTCAYGKSYAHALRHMRSGRAWILLEAF